MAGPAFAAWGILLPGGFPITHPRFWANQVLPWVVAWLSLAPLLAIRWKHRCLASVMPMLPALLTGLILGCVVLYPHGVHSPFFLTAIAGWVYVLVAFLRTMRRESLTGVRCLSTVAALATGAGWALSQRAPGPTTQPMNDAVPAEARRVEGILPMRFLSGTTSLILNPLMEIDSVSPDGFWTLFTPDAVLDTELTPYLLRESDRSFTLWTECGDVVWSHLNTFVQVGLHADAPLSISFSPIPGKRFALLPSDYPVGRPARAAAYHADGMFRVWEASSGEKGPFHLLGEGPHRAEDSLTVGIYAGDRLVFTLEMDDFTRQCSTRPSPSAGWGFPQNAIEFGSAGENLNAGDIFMSLASTSVGRGWDTVGIGPGIYRNRMRVFSH